MMQVKKSAIHKLTVEGTCGCKVSAEYEDPAYKKKIGDTVFTPCATHKGVPGLELLEGILEQALTREATEFKLPVPTAIDRPERTTQHRPVAAEGERPQRTAPVAGTPRPMRPAKTEARVIGGGGGIRRADPGMLPRGSRAAAAGAGARTASAATVPSMDIDMEPIPEDRRVTKLLEAEGLSSILDGNDPSMEADGEDIDLGDGDLEF